MILRAFKTKYMKKRPGKRIKAFYKYMRLEPFPQKFSKTINRPKKSQ